MSSFVYPQMAHIFLYEGNLDLLDRKIDLGAYFSGLRRSHRTIEPTSWAVQAFKTSASNETVIRNMYYLASDLQDAGLGRFELAREEAGKTATPAVFILHDGASYRDFGVAVVAAAGYQQKKAQGTFQKYKLPSGKVIQLRCLEVLSPEDRQALANYLLKE